MKSIIPAAGFGTRMLPAAKAVPKELLPVLDKPVIQYVLEEAAAGGIDDVLIVTSKDKRAIEDHFDRNAELEDRLRAGGKEKLLASVAAIIAKVKIHAVRQMQQRGLGDAVYQGKQHVGDNPFVCLLGDTIFSGPGPSKQLIDAYAQLGTSIIGVEEVAPEKVDRYGIVGGDLVSDGLLKLNTIVEKPTKEAAPSRYAVAARYLLSPRIFNCIERTAPGKGGEIQLTDAIKLLIDEEPVHALVLKGKRHDIGNPVDWLKTNILFASKDPELWREILPLIQSVGK